jgi:hypothetical protein
MKFGLISRLPVSRSVQYSSESSYGHETEILLITACTKSWGWLARYRRADGLIGQSCLAKPRISQDIPDQDVQVRHVWNKVLHRKRSIPVWNCAVRLSTWTYLPLNFISILQFARCHTSHELTWKVTKMTTQQASLSEWLRWRNLSTNRAAHRDTVQKLTASSSL